MPTGSSYPRDILAGMSPARRCAALAALAVLAACSTPPQPEQKVVTLQTTSAAPAATPVTPVTSDPAAARPRERLDMTPEEKDQLFTTYNQCLADHGVDKRAMDEKSAGPAEAACLGKKPLPPWEYDTANPESADFTHKVVLCLRQKGVKYVEDEPAAPGSDRTSIALGGKDNDSASISKGLDLIPVCEKELSIGGNR
jgi:hypothetical protein